MAGRPADTLRLLDSALVETHDARQRAANELIRGRVFMLQGRIDLAYGVLADEATAIREIDPELSATMLAEACLGCCMSLDLERAVAAGREAYAAAARGSAAVHAFASVTLAAALLLSGDRPQAASLLDRCLPLLRSSDPLTEAGALLAAAALCYFWLERQTDAAQLLAGLISSARKASAPAALLVPLSCRAELDFRMGRWTVATAEFEQVADLGEEMARSVYAAYASECLSRLAAARGDEARCRSHADRAMRLIDEHHNELGRLYVHAARGLLELGLGRVDPAIGLLEQARDLARRQGISEPNVVHWQPDLIEAYVRAGRIADAEGELAVLARQAECTGGQWALGSAARCAGLLADEREFDGWFASALEHHASGDSVFDIARTHLCHGERLRRAGRRADARAPLRQAIQAFERLGAGPWIERAQNELRATGETHRGRRHSSDSDRLTTHELQVALVVAQGASNREAAAALFLSPKTIEFHLARVYRKLGIRTRSELAALAARRGWFDSPSSVTGPTH
jgi:DNA-binding CsgD family transcriptional regulator